MNKRSLLCTPFVGYRNISEAVAVRHGYSSADDRFHDVCSKTTSENFSFPVHECHSGVSYGKLIKLSMKQQQIHTGPEDMLAVTRVSLAWSGGWVRLQ